MRKMLRTRISTDFRIVREINELISPIVDGDMKFIYSLYECHYNEEGKVVSMFRVDEMSGYSKADAMDFLMRMSAATLKPIINIYGEEVDGSLMSTKKSILDAIGRRI